MSYVTVYRVEENGDVVEDDPVTTTQADGAAWELSTALAHLAYK